ncbi:MAG: type II toxin-antitoxin system VapB family antitoxin [Gemmatimonadetes bacterium]|nr:type II toxin-antitoxin system VapB family antitoxin [Gemmatimonadota bacterium]
MAIRRKNLNIDQDKLDRAKEILGVETETEAVELALDNVLFADEMRAGLDVLAAVGVDPVFATPGERARLGESS